MTFKKSYFVVYLYVYCRWDREFCSLCLFTLSLLDGLISYISMYVYVCIFLSLKGNLDIALLFGYHNGAGSMNGSVHVCWDDLRISRCCLGIIHISISRRYRLDEKR